MSNLLKKGFKNIQIVAKEDFYTEFEDVYQQSGANSKGEFLRILLENYLNPDFENAVKKIEAAKEFEINSRQENIERLTIAHNETVSDLETVKTELETTRTRLNTFLSGIRGLFEKAHGKILQLPKKGKIEVKTEEDLFSIMVTTFKFAE